jgi:probable phosphoglycerate mutase
MARRPEDLQDGQDLFEDSQPADLTSRAVPIRRLIVEADGGSRGNPGPAAYGALVRDAESLTVLAAEGLPIGVATNNVAEYRGLIAGLEMAHEVDPAAAVEVRMDSRLVIEQMAGRWKIKHPDMKPLARAASRVRPTQVIWTWVPREQNKAADSLVNKALDGAPVTRHEVSR